MIWDKPPEQIEEWIDKVFNRKKEETAEVVIMEHEIE